MATSKTEPLPMAIPGQIGDQPEQEHQQIGQGYTSTIVRPKGSSITLEGSGRHDGSDINNSLSLLDMYNLILRDRAKQRRQE